jgi:hypothetical protein
MTVYCGLLHGPDGTKLSAIALCRCGDLGDGEAAAAPIKAFATPAMDIIGPASYCDHNRTFDAAFPRGAHNYWKSSFLTELTDDAIRIAVDGYARVPSPMSRIFFEHVHGRAASVPADATAFSHRRPGFNFGVFSQWAEPAGTERGETHWAMERFCATGRCGNYQSEEGADVAAAVYGANLARLKEVKRKYDPENVFHLNQNIVP